jgi:hypothetical protein
MIDNPTCGKCDDVETLSHKILECPYSGRIAKELFRFTNQMRITCIDTARITIEDLMGVTEPNFITMTLHAEVLSRILSIRDDAPYLIRPSVLVKQSLEHVIKVERNSEIRNALKNLI